MRKSLTRIGKESRLCTMKTLSTLKNMARRLLPSFNLYKICPVDFSYQNFGSKWLVVMRGSEENIELNFNGLYNFGATNGKLEYHDAAKTVATFWTCEQNLLWAFAQIRLNHHLLCGRGRNTKGKRQGLWSKACDGARASLERFKLYTEPFLRFDTPSLEIHGTGKVTAERPDYDGKDLIIFDSMKDKGSAKEVETELDAEPSNV